MKENRMFKYPLVLGVVALVAGLLLALVYNITAPIIEKNKNIRENAAIVEIFGESAKIENISDTIEDKDLSKGVNNAYIVKSSGKTYYVYKITIKDGVGSDNSSAILALSNGKVYTLKLTSVGDDYAKKYNGDSYVDGIKNKGSLEDGDVVSGATATGVYVVESVNAAIAHYGRVK